MPQGNPSTSGSNNVHSSKHKGKPGGNYRPWQAKNSKNNLRPGLKGFLVVLNLKQATNKSEKIDELYTFFEKFALPEDSIIAEGQTRIRSVSPPVVKGQKDKLTIESLVKSVGSIDLNKKEDNENDTSNLSPKVQSPLAPNDVAFVPRDLCGQKSTNKLPNSSGDNDSNASAPTNPHFPGTSSSPPGEESQCSSSSNSQTGSVKSEKLNCSPKLGAHSKGVVRRRGEENRCSTPGSKATASVPRIVSSSTSTSAAVTANKSPSTPNTNSPAKTLTKQQIKRKQFYQMQAATQNMPKPQIHFTNPVINDDSPFMPKLSSKPHAIKPLNLQPVKDPKSGKVYYEHPYRVEIDRWIPSKAFLSRTEQQWPIRKLRETSYHVVHTLQSLNMMMRDLRAASEIAFDVEHSDRSYFGLTCLIQISTRLKDYLVDCFSLRDHLHCLNEIFADPNVIKVAHSAHCDVTYLQKDFGVYVVGLFDTSEAEKVVTDSKQAVGLATLLTKYLNVETDKKYQLADWRIRPLPPPMVDYARSDSHFLLNLYDLQKAAIFDKYPNDPDGRGRVALLRVYDSSKYICHIRYEKPDLTDWVNKSRKRFTNQQMYALTELNNWRIHVAKQEDDGLYYIASNKTLLALAEFLPKTRLEMIDAVRKARSGHITDFIFKDIAVILKIFEDARSLPMIAPKDDEFKRKVVGSLFTTQVSNLVFFKAKPVDHAQVVYKIMAEFSGERVFASPNYVQRIIPIHTTCERDSAMISGAVKNLLLTNVGFMDTSKTPNGIADDMPVSDHTDQGKLYEISCNFPFDKLHELISTVTAAVSEVRPDFVFTEDKSDFCVIVYGISKSMCGVSVVNHYRKFNEFYLLPPTEMPHQLNQ